MQLHKERVQDLRTKNSLSTIKIQTQQLSALYDMRIDHLNKQHALEWDNQIAYSKKADRELKKKHVLELKQHPKGLKVNKTSCDAGQRFYIELSLLLDQEATG